VEANIRMLGGDAVQQSWKIAGTRSDKTLAMR